MRTPVTITNSIQSALAHGGFARWRGSAVTICGPDPVLQAVVVVFAHAIA
jgi:hypothetical protein